MIRIRKIIKSSIDSSLYYYIILLFIFIIGTVAGSLLIKILSTDTSLKFINFASPYIELDLSALEFFKKSIIFNILFLGTTFLFGILNIGILSILLVLFRGSILGLTVGFIIQSYGVKGFIVAVFGIYPQYIVYLPSILLAGALSILFDKRTNLINMKKHRIVKITVSDYVILLLLIVMIMTIGSIYEGFISPIFFKL